MSTRRTILRAIDRCAERRDSYVRMAPAAFVAGDVKIMSYVADRYARHAHSIGLLRRRLHRTKRFRILWWNVFAVLGASALFVWFLITILEGIGT